MTHPMENSCDFLILFHSEMGTYQDNSTSWHEWEFPNQSQNKELLVYSDLFFPPNIEIEFKNMKIFFHFDLIFWS